MQGILLVAVGGAVGSVARYLVGALALRSFGTGWPYGTWAVNVIGAFLIGALAGLLAHKGGAGQDKVRLLLQIGVLGGFTTFSSYSLEVALMVERREFAQAAVYAASSVVLCVTAVFLGIATMRRLFA